MKKIIAATLLFCLLLSLFAACAEKPNEASQASPQSFSPGYANALSAAEPDDPDSEERAPVAAQSYDDIFTALQNHANTMNYGMRGFMIAGGIMPEMAIAESDAGISTPAEAPMPSSAPMADQLEGAKGSDYSETNVQVAGIDEGDIVKTDGKYIYVLRNNELIIFGADGADTKQLSRTTVCKTEGDRAFPDDSKDYFYSYEYATEMFVVGGKLAVLTSYSDHSQLFRNDQYIYDDNQIAKLYIYDVSNPGSPKLTAQLGQDGHPLTARVIDSTLYLVSTYYVWNPIEGEPDTFVPSMYVDGEPSLVARDCIVIMPFRNSTSYTVISSYDLDKAALNESLSVLGGGGTVYMNHENLFIANRSTDVQEKAPYMDGVYKVIEYSNTEVTDITKFDISGGGITLSEFCTVPGALLNQFSLDEYKGHLRVVTTTYSSSYSVYTDERMGWSNYRWGDNINANALFVLDGSMNIVGRIEGLAKDERVYSVRFSGDIGYFVTFRQVDPLFAVDLTVPSAPKILSELKIPGFSEYLHVFGDGLLFGLGRDADEDTGRVGSMKLSMFDTSDPTDVTEKHTLIIESYHSTALYNHKAILISPQKNIIAFPVDDGYAVYGYSVTEGFSRTALITDVIRNWYGDTRGLYIGDFAYIVTSDRIAVLNMDSFTLVTNIGF